MRTDSWTGCAMHFAWRLYLGISWRRTLLRTLIHQAYSGGEDTNKVCV